MSATNSIEDLRAVSSILLGLDDERARRFAVALEEYLAAARYGLTLEQALGLTPAHGKRPWWVLEDLRRRDELLRAVRAAHFPRVGDRPAAAAIAQALGRYQAGRWRTERGNMEPPEGLRGDLFRLLKLGAPLSEDTIRRALAVGSSDTCSREPDAA